MRRKKQKARAGAGRLQSWFGGGRDSFNAARKAQSARKRKGLHHVLAKVVKRRTGETQYYLGKPHQVEGLKERFEVRVM